jgi:rhodanese-related sulfurtransferase
MRLKEMVADARGRVREVSPEDVKRALDSGDELLLLDVREPHEFADGHIPGALNVPRGLLELMADSDSPVADPAVVGASRVVTYCIKAPGARSLFAADTLTKMGFTDVAAMPAGLNGWMEAGLPLDRL